MRRNKMEEKKEEVKVERPKRSTKSKVMTVMLGVTLFCIFSLLLIAIFDDELIFGKKNNLQPAPQKEDNNGNNNTGEYDKTITVDGREYKIKCVNENDKEVTYINNKVISDDFCGYEVHAMNDYILVVNGMPQFGSLFKFYDKDLNEMTLDVNYYYTVPEESEDGTLIINGNKIKTDFLNREFEYGVDGIYIDNKYIHGNYENKTSCPDGEKKISEYKATIEKYKDNILSGTVELNYENGNMTYNYLNKKTIWDVYGKAIENNSVDYCVE